jgi:hypothetical protein
MNPNCSYCSANLLHPNLIPNLYTSMSASMLAEPCSNFPVLPVFPCVLHHTTPNTESFELATATMELLQKRRDRMARMVQELSGKVDASSGEAMVRACGRDQTC